MSYWREIALSVFCGVLIGLEREVKLKPAGMRTCALVCLGSALFTILSRTANFGPATDQTRIASVVVQGIGFIGAGAILQYHDKVIGLTTAAIIWVVAAIGMAIGFQYYTLAIETTLTTMAIVVLFSYLEAKVQSFNKDPFR